jgi:hypothetical protein
MMREAVCGILHDAECKTKRKYCTPPQGLALAAAIAAETNNLSIISLPFAEDFAAEFVVHSAASMGATKR